MGEELDSPYRSISIINLKKIRDTEKSALEYTVITGTGKIHTKNAKISGKTWEKWIFA